MVFIVSDLVCWFYHSVYFFIVAAERYALQAYYYLKRPTSVRDKGLWPHRLNSLVAYIIVFLRYIGRTITMIRTQFCRPKSCTHYISVSHSDTWSHRIIHK